MYLHCELVLLIFALILDGQVSGDHQAVPHSRPYMVLLEGYMENGKVKHCGGFLLNEELVMTAAHCQASSYTALLGVHNVIKTNEIQRVPVEKSFPHKDFNRSEPHKHDIMLLKLSSKVNFSKNVRPIALAGQDDGFLPQSCIVSGWGSPSTNSMYMSNTLMEVSVALTECAAEKAYCTEGETRPSYGDGGGPLVCEDGRAYGVTSCLFHVHSGGPKLHIYTKIPDYISWINTTIDIALESANTCHVYL